MSQMKLVSIHSCRSSSSSCRKIPVSSCRNQQQPSTVHGNFDKRQLKFLLQKPVNVENSDSSVSNASKFGLERALISSVTVLLFSEVAGTQYIKYCNAYWVAMETASLYNYKAMALVATPMADALTMDNLQEAAGSLILADASSGDWLAGILYSAGQDANVAVQGQLSDLGFASLAVIFGAGLVTSLSPCTLSVLPLTLGYIGAFGAGKSQTEVIGNSISFAMGLATTLALLGIAASFAGKAYGQIGQGLPIAASLLAVVMGLNLLEVIKLELPSFFNNFDPRAAATNFPSSVQAYLAGLTFALAASPCSTPVLASILGYVASTKDPVIGGSLLLAYTTGYVTPLLVAASFAGALQSLLSFRKFSAWINPMSGALLLGGGLYTFLDRLFPPTMSM